MQNPWKDRGYSGEWAVVGVTGGGVVYTFGDYRVDTARFEIARAGRPLPVEPQVLELLIALIENRDHVMVREELLEKVWRGRVVSDTTLSSRIKTTRQLIGDDGAAQRYIRTVHGRGFRFVGEVAAAAEGRPPAPPDAEHPVTRYAKSGDIHVAYQVFGDGPVNFILAPGFFSHVEAQWDYAPWAAVLRRLGERARVAVFDKRGTGLSDPVVSVPGMEQRMDDLRAVMDAAGFETAFVMGISEGAALAALFAAHHPARCDGLIMYGAFAEYRRLFSEDRVNEAFEYAETDWGSGKSLSYFAPFAAGDAELQRWWGKMERLTATPGAAISLMRMNSQIDISAVVGSIRVPTLVIHRSGDTMIDVGVGRSLASRMPGAEYVEIPGGDHLPFVNPDQIFRAVESYIARGRRREKSARVVATILQIRAAARALSGAHTAAVEEALRRYCVTRSSSADGGMTATFDGPGRALECAVSVSRLLRARGIAHRIGVHTGEILLQAAALEGPAIDISLDVAAHAGNHEILASRTVHDLVAGTAVVLENRGEHSLPSIGQRWHLFRVRGLN